MAIASGRRYGVAVRAAQTGDTAELMRLLAQRDAGPNAGPAAGPVAARLEALRQHAQGAVLVATGYGGLSGLVAITWAPSLRFDRPVARMLALVVDVDERRAGIGRMLVKAASQAARSAGCEVLEVGVEEGEDAATGFYQATGFVAAGAWFTRPLRRRGEEA